MSGAPGAVDQAAPGLSGGRVMTPLIDVVFEGNPVRAVDRAGSDAVMLCSASAAQRATLLDPRSGPVADSWAMFLDGWSSAVELHRAPSTEAVVTVEAWFAPRAFAPGGARGFTAIVDASEPESESVPQRHAGFALGHDRAGRIAALVDGRVLAGSRRLALDAWNYLALSISNGRAELRLGGEPVGAFEVPAGDIRLPARILLGRLRDGELLEGLFPLAAAIGLLGPMRIRPAAASAASVTNAAGAIADAAADTAPDRARYASDPHRPIAHVSAPQGWMNEPHAALHADGVHHLFSQHNPGGPYWGHIAWGHAVSRDLVHWEDSAIAIAPAAETVAPDGIWSGSSVVAPGGEHLLYFTAGDFGRRPDQSVVVARPDGVGWVVDENPVLEMPASVPGHDEALVTGQFRDPFVWREGDDWFLLVGAGLEGRGGAALLFHSRDGDHWEQQEPLLVGDVDGFPATGVMWELPVLLPVGNGADGTLRHALFVAPWWAGDSEHHLQHVWHWIGVWDAAARRFTPDDPDPREFDGGGHLTGPSGTVLDDGRSILWTIAQDTRSLAEFAATGWAHNAGFPLELGLHDDGTLAVRPVAELRLLRERPIALDRSIIDARKRADDASALLHGRHFELELEVDGAGFEIEVLRSADGSETTLLGVSGTEVWIDRSRSSLRPEHTEGRRSIRHPASPTVHARLLVDGSMVELYVDDRVSLTSRAYPVSADARDLRLRLARGARLISCSAYELHPAYRPRKAD
ncbi:GH32 C-terminal domain-containing protein [Agromyces albus]|uniref:GH32 C-terminal domain-containing protein n=1 Tax=Agromyces albus TaxID=205332 RepID=UPI002781F53D|nr:GH32 C-terminal domain-containing protein [Agromyces albus]MDQ0576635.1 sucrose-6-phosphate hydrolase SacC (GH32 family) [Agromyces albus]